MRSVSIALRSVKRSSRDYAVYLLTLTFGVCVFYVFNSLESQQAVMEVTKGGAMYFRILARLMGAVSVFVSVILGLLIVYANMFLIRRRKKEFGIYMTLGMDKGQISRILVVETALAGAVALVLGLTIGILLSQGMAAVTARLMGFQIARLVFVFSGSAAVKTALNFGVIFLIVLLLNTLAVGRTRLIDLIYADRKNERFKTPSPGASAVLFAVAIVMLLLAYIVVLKQGLRVFMSPPVLVVTLALGAGGTLLLFRTASVTVIGFMERRRGIYLRNLNMFILRQMGSRINTSYVTMALVCLMLFISLSAVFTGMGMSSAILQEAGEWAEDAAASATMVSYLAVYLGVVFMIAAAAVLAIGQLSDASDNAARYGLLRKLGAEERMISRAFFTQTLIYFAAPTIPALVHTAVAMRMFEGQLTILIGSGGGESGMLAAAAALAVYIGYFIAAYRGGRAIVLTAGRG